jgi:hypothetical protein
MYYYLHSFIVNEWTFIIAREEGSWPDTLNSASERNKIRSTLTPKIQISSTSISQPLLPSDMSVFEPATVLALLKFLERPKEQKNFEENWKQQVRSQSKPT